MYLKTFLFLLCSIAFMFLFDVRFSFRGTKGKIEEKMKSLQSTKRPQTAKEFIEDLGGKDRRNYLQKNKDAAFSALEKTGRKNKFGKTMLLAKILSVSSFMGCLLIQNYILAPVLAIGLYFIPLWLTKLYVYRYDKFVREELETALSLITTSYMRHNDLQKAVEENIDCIKNPVASAFRQFLQGLKYVNANVAVQVEHLSNRLDNKIFHKWCDMIILCQDDHTMKATLSPIVAKFSDVKAQEAENETNMMLPIQEIQQMTLAVASPIPILYIINRVWFEGLIYTFIGQSVMAVSATLVFISWNKAITLCSPIEYDI